MASGDLLSTSRKDHPLRKQPGWSLSPGSSYKILFPSSSISLGVVRLSYVVTVPRQPYFCSSISLFSTPVLSLSFSLAPFWPYFSKTLKHIGRGCAHLSWTPPVSWVQTCLRCLLLVVALMEWVFSGSAIQLSHIQFKTDEPLLR